MSMEIPPIGDLIANKALHQSSVDTAENGKLAGNDVSEVLVEISATASNLTENTVTEAKIVASAMQRVNEITGHDFDVRLFMNGVVASEARAEHRRRNPRTPKFRI